MKNGFVIAVAIIAFALGAWMSPRLQADTEAIVPVLPKPGDAVLLHSGLASDCLVEAVSSVAKGWISCGGVWWNLSTGVGYSVRADR